MDKSHSPFQIRANIQIIRGVLIFHNTTIFHIIRFVYTNAIFQNTNVRKEYFPKFPGYTNEKCFSLVLHNYYNQGIFCPKLVCLAHVELTLRRMGLWNSYPFIAPYYDFSDLATYFQDKKNISCLCYFVFYIYYFRI